MQDAVNEVTEMNGWLISVSADGQYVHMQLDGSPGQVQVKADDEGLVVDIFNDNEEPESVGSTYALYAELERE